MQFEVPQFIEIEDKIFGPLTWRQFIYVGGGGLMTAVLFFVFPFFVFVLVGVPIGALALALAFYPVNNRPFSHFLEAVYNFFLRKRVYHWHQKAPTIYKETPNKNEVRNPYDFNQNQKKDISSLARRLELDALQKK